jgi:hypothetical protein
LLARLPCFLDNLLFVSVRSKEKKRGILLMDDLEATVDERLRNLQELTTYDMQPSREGH